MIIAEIGQNHCGYMDLAYRLIRLAKDNGADLAKFQLYDHNISYKDHPEIPDVALSLDQAKMLFDYGEEVGIEVFFSVFDIERVRWCEEIGVRRYKLASGSVSNRELFDALRDTRKPVIASLPYGKCRKEDLKWIYRPNLWAFLYCVPEYPAKPTLLGDLEFGCYKQYQGYSDHSPGLDVVKIMMARGAQIIEKHFSLCYNVGIDGAWSMTPSDLKELKRWENVCKEVL